MQNLRTRYTENGGRVQCDSEKDAGRERERWKEIAARVYSITFCWTFHFPFDTAGDDAFILSEPFELIFVPNVLNELNQNEGSKIVCVCGCVRTRILWFWFFKWRQCFSFKYWTTKYSANVTLLIQALWSTHEYATVMQIKWVGDWFSVPNFKCTQWVTTAMSAPMTRKCAHVTQDRIYIFNLTNCYQELIMCFSVFVLAHTLRKYTGRSFKSWCARKWSATF